MELTDERAFYQRYAGRIRSYGLRHLRDPERAQELMQQVLLAVLEALRERRVRDSERLDSYVFGTCRNAVMDFRRGESRQRRLHVVETRVEAGTRAHARFARGVDVLVHVLKADLSRARRVDLELVTADGVSKIAHEGVPFDPVRGEVLVACQRHYQNMFAPNEDPIFRVLVVEGAERRTVGEYLVVHEWA